MQLLDSNLTFTSAKNLEYFKKQTYDQKGYLIFWKELLDFIEE